MDLSHTLGKIDPVKWVVACFTPPHGYPAVLPGLWYSLNTKLST